MKLCPRRIACFCAPTLLAAAASGQFTEYSSKAAYDAAVGPHATIHFTEVALGTTLTTQYLAQGATFTDGNDVTTSNAAFVVDGVGVNAAGRIGISFSSPQNHVGVEFPGAIRIELYNGPNLLYASSNFAGSGTGFFGGVQSVATFDRALLIDWFDDLAFIDDFHFEGGTPPPSAYCTAGTTTNLCVPSMSGVGTPSASAASGFTIRADNVEGQKSGIIFYSVSGPQAVPWAVGSTSYLCVKAPTQRMSALSSGGTLNQCNGVLSQDWHAFMAANPTAVGNPRYVGESFDAQGWFRDPPAPKTTNLSNALHFVLGA